HSYSIKVGALDNPGWSIEIDLEDTDINFNNIPSTLIEFSEHKWIAYKVEDRCFQAFGGPLNLNLLIKVFKLLVDNGEIDENKVREYLKEYS
ncbi:MAG: immunity 53 family protein, partial [Flavobacteriaceae bacterium]|nr:immunity 53 family protein [Flavobacteriaceae bacterium]